MGHGPKAEVWLAQGTFGIKPSTLLPKIPNATGQGGLWVEQSVSLLKKALSRALMNARAVPREAEERQKGDRL